MVQQADIERRDLWTAGTSERVRVLVLGPLSIEHDGSPVHVAGTHRRRLLAYLASRAGRVVGVGAIVDALWGDDPPPSAAKTIQSHVARLRGSLSGVGRNLIETTPGGYRLTEDGVEVDADVFDRLASDGHRRVATGDLTGAVSVLTAALDLWRGSPYSDFPDVEFAVHERMRLTEAHSTAVEDLAEAQLESGATSAATGDLERLVSEHPGRERAWGLLMRALYAAGRQHDALVAFQRARRALAESFGLDPGPELRSLEQLILEQDPGLTVARRTEVPPMLRFGPESLVGRAIELAWLTEAWDASRHGRGQLCILVGSSESGRTRLAAQLAVVAAGDHGEVLYTRAADGLGAVLGTEASLPQPAHVVDAIVERSRRHPVVVVVDDVEWATAATMDAVAALARAIEPLAAMLVLVADPAGGGPAIEVLGRLDPSGGRTLRVGPLPDEEVARMVALDGIADPAAVAAIVSVAAGCPGVARREATAWAEQVAGERLNRAAATSATALAAADEARDSVVEEVAGLVRARARRHQLANEAWLGRQPYRGLSSYGPADADVFVGRERLVAELATRVLDRRLVIVTGASGSGKSSLVRAGLIPLVKSGRLPGATAWRVNVTVPGDDPLRPLDELADLDEPGPQLLVIDQFEEAFVNSPAVVDRLVGRLLDLALDPAVDAHIVLVVRADQYGRLAEARHLAELLDDAPVLVGRPSDAELRRIIEEPALRAGCRVEPALVAAVLADFGDADGALPLVSTTLAELWERRTDDALTVDQYLSIGGVAASVERLGSRVLDAVGGAGEEAVRRVLLLLADVTDDGSWVRRRVRLDAIPDELVPTVDAMVDGRIVVRAGDTVEIVHEVVFRAWPRLQAWLNDARRDLVLGRDLRLAARAWADHGRADDDVYRGARLAAAAEWCERNPEAVTASIRTFVDAGTEVADRGRLEAEAQLARERRAGRRLRRSLVAASLLLVVSLVGAGLTVAARRRADDATVRAEDAAAQAEDAAAVASDREAEAATARDAESAARRQAETERDEAEVARLVAESERATEQRLDLALLLAVEARRHADTIDTRGALLTALTQTLPDPAPAVELDTPVTSSLRGFIPSGLARVFDVAISANGRTIAVTGLTAAGRPLFVAFDARTRAELLRVDADLGNPFLDPKGAYVLVENLNAVEIYGIRDTTRRQVVEVRPGGPGILEASLSPDGSTVGVIFEDESIAFYDARTGRFLDAATPPPGALGGRFAWDGSFTYGTIPADTGVLELHFWAVRAGVERRRVALEPPGDVYPSTYVFSPDMALIVGIDRLGVGTMDVWNATTGELVGDRSQRPRKARGFPAFVSDRIVALGRYDGLIVLYDLASERLVRAPLRASGGGIWDLDATPDGRTLVSVGDDGLIRIWSADDRGLIDAPVAAGADLLAVSADRSRMAVLAANGTVEVRSIDGSTRPVEIPTPAELRGGTHYGSMSADGGRVADLNIAAIPRVRVADTTTGDVIWTSGEAEAIDAAVISADGTRVYVVSDGFSVLSLIDVESGDVLATIRNGDLGPVDITDWLTPSADGRFLDLSAFEHIARLDADTLDPIRTIAIGRAAGQQGNLAPMPGTDSMVGAAIQGRLLRVDMATGDVTAGQSRDITSLYGVAVTPDGTMIAAGQPFTSSIALFDAETLQPIGRPIPAADPTAPPAFTADGDLVADSRFGVSRWEMDPDEWQDTACSVAGRNLTRTEWGEYLGDEPYRATCPRWPSPTDDE